MSLFNSHSSPNIFNGEDSAEKYITPIKPNFETPDIEHFINQLLKKLDPNKVQ